MNTQPLIERYRVHIRYHNQTYSLASYPRYRCLSSDGPDLPLLWDSYVLQTLDSFEAVRAYLSQWNHPDRVAKLELIEAILVSLSAGNQLNSVREGSNTPQLFAVTQETIDKMRERFNSNQ